MSLHFEPGFARGGHGERHGELLFAKEHPRDVRSRGFIPDPLYVDGGKGKRGDQVRQGNVTRSAHVAFYYAGRRAGHSGLLVTTIVKLVRGESASDRRVATTVSR